MRTIGDFLVHPLCLGGNVFGWTADEKHSFAVLDAYADAGGNFIDTANGYSDGESETIIGKWMAARGNRFDMVIATKVGGRQSQTRDVIRRELEGSLRRLGTDHVDIYYAHRDDPEVPLEESLAAFNALVRGGKVRHIAASNFTAARLNEALALAERDGLAKYVALQPHYNLMERGYEQDLAETVAAQGMVCVPYFGLARGFLTGKYRPGQTDSGSPRAAGAAKYLDERGLAVLSELDAIAQAHATTVAAVALAWLAARPTVATPIASARTPEQLADLLPMATLELTGEELARLTTASDTASG
jgi:aryl-alcohol dehydrogenase-like predicted oxidoreductase